MEKHIFHPGGLALTFQGAEYAQVNSTSLILDIGCGTGTSLKYLHDTYGCSIYGIDISETAVAKARELMPYATILPSDASSLPFERGFFDVVFMECTLSLFHNPLQALKEAYRVLKPNGSLVILTLSQSSGTQLVQEGTVRLNHLTNTLSMLNFTDIFYEDHTPDLIQFVVDMIFQYGSLAAYLNEASQTIDGCVLDCNISPKNTGYHLVAAKKKEE